eukprot:14405923-Ditylum_brightwellii.AAC.1
MKPFVRAILAKLGFNCNTTRKIIFGSIKYGSFQLTYLHLEQGHLAIKHFLGHVREETMTGDQIIISQSKAQLISGSSYLLLQDVGSNRSYVLANWLCNIRTFLEHFKAFITVPGAWCPKKQRVPIQSAGTILPKVA